MGLDNGIMIKKNRKIEKKFQDKYDYYAYADSYEIVYWRKCWNLRAAVQSITGVYFDNADVRLKKEDIEDLIEFLGKLNEKNWESYGYSIWSWEEYEDNIQKNIEDLKYLLKYMKKYPKEVEVWFYDSY